MKSKIEETLNAQFETLISEGENLVKLCGSSGSEIQGTALAKISSWVARSTQLIKNVGSENSPYYQQLLITIEQYGEGFYELHSNHYTQLAVVLGYVQALFADFNAGVLHDVRALLRAELFGDFLEMAEYLLGESYKDAAAVLIGAVLEDSLRKLAQRNGVAIENPDGSLKNMERLNQDVYKVDVYDKLINKQIISWGDLRNKAAHGQFGLYDSDHVRMMLLFVQKFVSDFVS